jgi:chemotaxis signal transduction protein
MAFDHMSAADGPAEPSTQNQLVPSLPDPATVPHKFVSFYSGDVHYAIPARAVAEVTNLLSPTPLPDSPQSLLGIAPHRGDILAIVETGTSSVSGDPLKKKSIVLRPIGDRFELPIAFNVDRIGEMVQFAATEIRSLSTSDPLADFEGSVSGERVLIVEPARIVNLVSV